MERYRVASVSDVAEGKPVTVTVKGIDLGIFSVNGCYVAWRNVCPHAAAPVCLGTIRGTKVSSGVYEYEYGYDNQILRCPWHGWEFDLTTGQHLATSAKLKGCPVEVDGEDVYVILP